LIFQGSAGLQGFNIQLPHLSLDRSFFHETIATVLWPCYRFFHNI